jgi:hypothetical protein
LDPVNIVPPPDAEPSPVVAKPLTALPVAPMSLFPVVFAVQAARVVSVAFPAPGATNTSLVRPLTDRIIIPPRGPVDAQAGTPSTSFALGSRRRCSYRRCR